MADSEYFNDDGSPHCVRCEWHDGEDHFTPDAPTASAACPICGEDEPHLHSQPQWEAKQLRENIFRPAFERSYRAGQYALATYHRLVGKWDLFPRRPKAHSISPHDEWYGLSYFDKDVDVCWRNFYAGAVAALDFVGKDAAAANNRPTSAGTAFRRCRMRYGETPEGEESRELLDYRQEALRVPPTNKPVAIGQTVEWQTQDGLHARGLLVHIKTGFIDGDKWTLSAVGGLLGFVAVLGYHMTQVVPLERLTVVSGSEARNG